VALGLMIRPEPFVLKTRKNGIDETGDLAGATRSIEAAKCAAYEKSQESGCRQSLRWMPFQNIFNVIDHALNVGLANVVGGGVYFVGS
jgi:hypothetical protein